MTSTRVVNMIKGKPAKKINTFKGFFLGEKISRNISEREVVRWSKKKQWSWNENHDEYRRFTSKVHKVIM